MGDTDVNVASSEGIADIQNYLADFNPKAKIHSDLDAECRCILLSTKK